MEEINMQEYAFIQKLKKMPSIEKIILYGSRARGDNRERSDIDLAIDCPHASIKEWHHIMDVIEDADTLLGIDCIRFDGLAKNNPLKEAILRDGVILYQKDSHGE